MKRTYKIIELISQDKEGNRISKFFTYGEIDPIEYHKAKGENFQMIGAGDLSREEAIKRIEHEFKFGAIDIVNEEVIIKEDNR